MYSKIGYYWDMDKGRLANYFEQNYLKWQLVHGRITQTEFAKLLKISKGYLNHLLEGSRSSLSFHTAVYIARFLGDFEILDILGFERPVDQAKEFPPEIESVLRSALLIIKDRGLSWNSPEAVGIITDAMSKLDSNLSLTIEESGISKKIITDKPSPEK